MYGESSMPSNVRCDILSIHVNQERTAIAAGQREGTEESLQSHDGLDTL